MIGETTDRLMLPLLQAGQAQKEVFHNEALTRIDMLLHGAVQAVGMTVPPAEAEDGQCWIVGLGSTGEWVGQDDAIACRTQGRWRFVSPREGMVMWVEASAAAVRYRDGGWHAETIREDGLYIHEIRVVGAQQEAIADPAGGTIIDVEARMAVSQALAALRAHGLIAAA